MIRKPNLSEKMLFGIENELLYIESIARAVPGDEREMLEACIKRLRRLVLLILDNVGECEAAGLTQTQYESLVAEYDDKSEF